jgi:hypothetical protein
VAPELNRDGCPGLDEHTALTTENRTGVSELQPACRQTQIRPDNRGREWIQTDPSQYMPGGRGACGPSQPITATRHGREASIAVEAEPPGYGAFELEPSPYQWALVLPLSYAGVPRKLDLSPWLGVLGYRGGLNDAEQRSQYESVAMGGHGD